MDNNIVTVETKETKKTLKEKVRGFAENHPKTTGVAKGVALGVGALIVGTAAFLFGRRSCDVVYVHDDASSETVNEDVPDVDESVDFVE